jgi:hypothetical protein
MVQIILHDTQQTHAEYRYKNLIFIITPTKIAVQTPLQFFFLKAKEPYYGRRLKTIQLLIEMGKIQTLNDLAEYTNGKVDWVNSYRQNL